MLDALAATVADDAKAEIDLQPAIGQTLAQLLKRPEVKIEFLVPVLRELAPALLNENGGSLSLSSAWVRNDLKSVETEIKYAAISTSSTSDRALEES